MLMLIYIIFNWIKEVIQMAWKLSLLLSLSMIKVWFKYDDFDV